VSSVRPSSAALQTSSDLAMRFQWCGMSQAACPFGPGSGPRIFNFLENFGRTKAMRAFSNWQQI